VSDGKVMMNDGLEGFGLSLIEMLLRHFLEDLENTTKDLSTASLLRNSIEILIIRRSLQSKE
jgi:hypothetical protein